MLGWIWHAQECTVNWARQAGQGNRDLTRAPCQVYRPPTAKPSYLGSLCRPMTISGKTTIAIAVDSKG